MRVLIACEFSAIVRDAFRARGHDAWSCDLLDTEGYSFWHLRCDARLVVTAPGWDLMIAHPPCQYLANSGVRWLHTQPGRVERMNEAAAFFNDLLAAPIPRICVENPIMHKHAKRIVTQEWTQTIQPWQFGHGETKRTCLWLKNLPPLRPTKIVDGREGRVWREGPSPDRWKERSRTLPGIAEAMADQWGVL